MLKDDLIRLRHMLDSAKEAMAFADGKTRKDLDKNRMLTLSLVKSSEIDRIFLFSMDKHCGDHKYSWLSNP